MEKIQDSEKFWNDSNLEMVKLNNEWYLLDGWNGERYTKCWKYSDRHGKNRSDNELYDLTPVQVGEGDPDDDGDYLQYETIGYEIFQSTHLV